MIPSSNPSPRAQHFPIPRPEIEGDFMPSSAKRSALMLAAVVAVLGAMSLLVFAHYQDAHRSQLQLLDK